MSKENLNFDWSDLAKKTQMPLQAFAELNMKTLKDFSYLQPSDLKKPDELVARQMEVLIENSHKTLDYIQKSFEILQQASTAILQEAKKRTEQ